MDTLYIKMADCPEIQGLWKKAKGDYAFMSVWGRVGIVGLDDEGASDGHSAGGTIATRYIWLPTQSQLQKMSGLSWREFDRTCQIYNEPTKEQAGIRVVMFELHQKIWVNDKWESK